MLREGCNKNFFFIWIFKENLVGGVGGVGWGRTFIPDSKVLFRPNSLIWETNKIFESIDFI